jgi:hypothetical protein
MGRAIKLLVLAWTAVALAVPVWLLQGGAWPRLGVLARGGFVATAIRIAFDRRGVAAVLVLPYVLPAIRFHYVGHPYWPHGLTSDGGFAVDRTGVVVDNSGASRPQTGTGAMCR